MSRSLSWRRRAFLKLVAASGVMAAAPAVHATTAKIPVIFHTDIGGDIDDTWALLLLLRRPELDLKLVVTEGSNTLYRQRLVAKLLALAGRSDVLIASDNDGRDDPAAQSDWIGDYSLKDFAGRVTGDFAGAIIDTVIQSKTPVTVISVGPATTLAKALKIRPSMANNARFVGMFGSVRQGYGAGKPPEAEYNVKQDVAGLRAVFAAPWLSCAITPLDTCGLVALDGADLQKVRASSDPFARACIANSEAWLPHAPWMPKDFDLTKTSSTLFDTVAVAMAYDESDLVMETLPITIRDDGMMLIDPAKGWPVRVATQWKDMAAFKHKLVAALTRQPS